MELANRVKEEGSWPTNIEKRTIIMEFYVCHWVTTINLDVDITGD